jgi:hypothetical protein
MHSFIINGTEYYNFGFKIHGVTYNSFLYEMVADEWYYASEVG